jgi:hypothetical protein
MRIWIAAAALLGLATAAAAQPPQPLENLEYFPKDIARDRLVQRMREFSFALGVRCQHCHSGGDGISFDGVDFSSDAKPAKVTARAMLRMLDQLNGPMLGALPSRAEPRVAVDCATCHRGLPLPKTLQTTLFEIVARDGAQAAVARYRQLRRDDTLSGRYNFGEWEINELARRLKEGGQDEAAIALMEMNGEFYPKSASIDWDLGELHRLRGDTARALARYRAALEKAPQMEQARRRIEELEKKPQ